MCARWCLNVCILVLLVLVFAISMLDFSIFNIAPSFLYTRAILGNLLPIGSEEREVLGVGRTTVAILPSCQDMKTIAL